jgi:hypothetical protein
MKNKNKMKKLVETVYKAQLALQLTIMSIAFMVLLFSCKKENPQPTLCDCVDVTYVLGNNNAGWIETERTSITKKDCWKHGETEEWTWTHQWHPPKYYKRVTECE